MNLLTQIAITGRSHENAALICANSLDTFRDGFARLRALQALELVWTSSEFDGRILASVLRGVLDGGDGPQTGAKVNPYVMVG